MQRLAASLIGVDSGRILLFSDFEDGGPMWTGDGPRLVRRTVLFSEPFRAPPTVQTAVELWDMDRQSNQRGDLFAENVARDRFELVFKTWGDTRVARLRASWLAIGELDIDDWKL